MIVAVDIGVFVQTLLAQLLMSTVRDSNDSINSNRLSTHSAFAMHCLHRTWQAKTPWLSTLLHLTCLHSLSICQHTKQTPSKSSSIASYSPRVTLLNARLAMRAIMACTQTPRSVTGANERCCLSHFPAMLSFFSMLAHRLNSIQKKSQCHQLQLQHTDSYRYNSNFWRSLP